MPTIRRASGADTTFLWQALALAADWRPDSSVRSPDEVMGDAKLAHYLEGWPRPSDVGFIAVEDRPVGAAWWRRLSAEDPGYGYVDDATPELSIAVIAEARGHGIGTQLLAALIDEARAQHIPALSLSVEHDNPARRLYERAGFTTISDSGGAATMLLNLTR